MTKQSLKHDEGFDVTLSARITGRTQHDGDIIIMTSDMAFDTLKQALMRMKESGQIKSYTLIVTDNLAEARETIKRNK